MPFGVYMSPSAPGTHVDLHNVATSIRTIQICHFSRRACPSPENEEKHEKTTVLYTRVRQMAQMHGLKQYFTSD